MFDSSVENAFVSSLEYGAGDKEGLIGALGPGHGFAVAPAGDMYLLESCGCLEKRGGNMEPLGRVDPGPSGIAAAVDPATGHLYVDDRSSIAEWDTGTMNGQLPTPTNDNGRHEQRRARLELWLSRSYPAPPKRAASP